MNRSGFLVASATLLAAGAPANADSVPGGTKFVERKADFDEAAFDKAVSRPADIRQVFEPVGFNPTILNSVKNSLNGLEFGFGYSADRIAIVVASHGPSSAYTFSDYVWQKYKIGQYIKANDASGAPLVANSFLKAKATDPANPDDPKGMYHDTQIETLQKRGVVFLTCHTAVEEHARKLVTQGFAPAGMSPTEVANDILTHLIPGAIVVPSMVATVAVLQAKHDYTYASIAF